MYHSCINSTKMRRVPFLLCMCWLKHLDQKFERLTVWLYYQKSYCMAYSPCQQIWLLRWVICVGFQVSASADGSPPDSSISIKYRNHARERHCKFCVVLEDETHFEFECKLFKSRRFLVFTSLGKSLNDINIMSHKDKWWMFNG